MNFGPGLLGPAAMSIEAERVPVSYPEGFRGRATGAILVDGDVGSYRISGLVDLTQAYYTAEFDARRESLDRLDYQLAALRGQGSILDSLPLAVDVRLKEPLRIRNSQAQVDVTGTVTANGTLAQPAATGQISLVEGGQVTVRRARIRAQEGRVELNGYPAGVPEVDFEGLTQVGGVTMNLRAQGSMNDLQLDISSPNRPDLSQTDLVALLLTGRTTTAAADEGGAIVAEELAAALGGRLQKNVGDTLLIDVSSDESMLLDEGDPTQRFKIGTRVGRDLAVFYSTRLDGTEQRWVGQWNPRGGRFTFRAIQDSEEGQIAEATDRLTFNVFPGRARGEKPKAELQKLDSLRFEGALPLPEEELRRASQAEGREALRPPAPGRGRRPRAEEAGRGRVPERVGRRARAGGRGREGPLRPRAEGGGGAEDRRLLDGRRPRREGPRAGPRGLAALRLARGRGGGARPRRAHRARGGRPLRGEGRPRAAGVGRRGRDRAERRPGAAGHGRRRGVRGKRGAHRRGAPAHLSEAGVAGVLRRPGPAGPTWWPGRGSPTRASATCARASGLRATRFEAASGRLLVTVPVREGASSLVAALALPDGVPRPGRADRG